MVSLCWIGDATASVFCVSSAVLFDSLFPLKDAGKICRFMRTVIVLIHHPEYEILFFSGPYQCAILLFASSGSQHYVMQSYCFMLGALNKILLEIATLPCNFSWFD